MTPTDYQNIDDYLLDRLAGKALEDFEKRLQNDAAFAAVFEEQQKSVQVLNRMADLELKTEIQEIGEKFKKERKSAPIIRRMRPWLVAASIAILLGVSYWFLQSPSNTQLYDQYYTAYAMNIGTRDAADNQAIKLAEASAYYKQKDYDAALKLIKSIPNAKNAKVQLMKGICQLELGNNNQAKTSFDQLIREKNSVFQYHAIWYSAMASLKAGDVDACKDFLHRLVEAQDPNGVFQQAAAKELLEKI